MKEKMIGANMRRLRRDNRKSQEYIAKMAGISRIAYRNIETGLSKPKVSTLQNIASALDVKMVDLLTPAKELKHVRFRSLKRMNSRESILIDVGRWLENYNYLEDLLNMKNPFKLAGFQDLLPPDLTGMERAKCAAMLARRRMGLNDHEPIRDIAGLIEDNGIKLYPVKIVNDAFFGLSVSDRDGGPAIIVNVWERISVERWIFSAAHELGHIVLHLDSYDVAQTEEDKKQESEASAFASCFLMPEDSFCSEWQESAGLDLIDRIFKVKSIFNVSYKTILYRLSEEYGPDIWRRFNAAYKKKSGQPLKNHDEPMGLDPSIFHGDPEALRANEPQNISQWHFVEDRLSRLVRKAVEDESISLSRAAEILDCDLSHMREIASSWV